MAHEHAAHSHSHAVGPDADRRRLGAALALIVAFMAVEVAAAVVAHSRGCGWRRARRAAR